MKRTWTIIGVRDVPSSFKWYQSLFGQPKTPPGHDYFGQILDKDGTVLLCLHQWGTHEHPSLLSPDAASPGNGLLLFFRVDDYKTTLQRARAPRGGGRTNAGSPPRRAAESGSFWSDVRAFAASNPPVSPPAAVTKGT